VNKELPHYYNSSPSFGQRKRKRAGRAMLVPPNPEDDRDNFLDFVNICVCQTGIHTHCFTCMKPPNGYVGCRLCKPSGDTDKTEPVYLKDTTLKQKVSKTKVEVSFDIIKDLWKKDVGLYDNNAQSNVSNGDMEVSNESQAGGRNDDIDLSSSSTPDGANRDIDNSCNSDKSGISRPDKSLIVWEIERPLLNRDDYDMRDGAGGEEEKNKEWYISNLAKAMTPRPRFKWPPPSVIEMTEVGIKDYAPDGNCLFACIRDNTARENLYVAWT